MTDGLYKDRLARGRLEEEARRRAIARDAAPYNRRKLEVKIPLGCTMIGITLVIGAMVGAAWLFRHWVG